MQYGRLYGCLVTNFIQKLNRQPSWTPSWISQNAQGCTECIRQILKEYVLVYHNQVKKKLCMSFPGSDQKRHLATGLVPQKYYWGRKFNAKFYFYLIMVDQGLLFQNLPDALGAPLSVLRNSRWRPRWPPFQRTSYNSCSIWPRMIILVSYRMFWGARILLKTFIWQVGDCSIQKCNMAAYMAA